MLNEIRNVYCVGRNYRQHAAELGNAVPEQPMLFVKPTHSLVLLEGQTLSLPGGSGEIHYEAELVVHVGRPYKQGATVDELIDKMALGIDFTLRDVQTELKKKGYPWLAAKGFVRSAPITPFIPFDGVKAAERTDFSLRINEVEVQRGNIGEMIFSLQQIVDFCAERYGLGVGDVIFTGTPAGVGAVQDADRLSLHWGGETLGHCVVRLDA